MLGDYADPVTSAVTQKAWIQSSSGDHTFNLPVYVSGNLELRVAEDSSITFNQLGFTTANGVLTKTLAGNVHAKKIVAQSLWIKDGMVELLDDGTHHLGLHVKSLMIVPNLAIPTPADPANVLYTGTSDVIIDYTGTSPMADLIDWINDGQIVADDIAFGSATAIYFADATDLGLTTFNGVTLDSTAVIGKFTDAGDANFDGVVDTNDYGVLDSTFGNSVLGPALGDLDFDGTVTLDDYGIVDSNFGAGSTNPLSPVIAVPEPSIIVFGAFIGSDLVSRRRFRC